MTFLFLGIDEDCERIKQEVANNIITKASIEDLLSRKPLLKLIDRKFKYQK